MKKFINKFIYVAFVVATSLVFVACSEDDEPGTGGTGNIKEGQLVDLGLSVYWAGWNVGASSPEGYGDYFAWGETKSKKDYSRYEYKYFNSEDGVIDIGANISGTKYDVARHKWGGEWRMPTKEEFNELIYKCQWEWTQEKGISGYKVTGPNGNSIFLPAAGNYDGETNEDKGSDVSYWSATVVVTSGYSSEEAYALLSSKQVNQSMNGTYRYDGLPVRPVMTKKVNEQPEEEGSEEGDSEEGSEEDDTEDESVLGVNLKLSSGTIWAKWNVGAITPEGYGEYYAWGETMEKSDYSLETYEYFKQDVGYVDKGYDVASQKWGDGWRMPTKEEFEELKRECEWDWTQLNGVYGYEVTGSNGKSIFLPAAGYRDGCLHYDAGNGGNYWSAELTNGGLEPTAWGFGFSSNYYGCSDGCYRIFGHTIRPVKSK